MNQLTSNPFVDPEAVPVASCPEEADATLQKLASRRSFLGRGVAAAAIPAALMATSSPSRAQGAVGGGRSFFPSYRPGSTVRNFQEIQADESSHVNIIITAIRSLGGTPRPYPIFKGIDIADPQTFLNLSVVFENTGVGAYFGAAPYIENKNVLAVAASIAFVEAYHSGFLNTLAGLPIVPGGPTITYAQPLTQAQVVSAATPFVASLNDPNNLFPPAFSTTPSHENDIAILNFALLLEYLEATFYFNSVRRVFA